MQAPAAQTRRGGASVVQNDEIVLIRRSGIVTTTEHLADDHRPIAEIRAARRESIRLRVLSAKRNAEVAHGRRGHPNLVVVIDEEFGCRRERRHGPGTGSH